MGKAGHLVSARNIINPKPVVKAKSVKPNNVNGASPRKQDQLALSSKKHLKAPRRLISVSTSHGGSTWDGRWSADHTFSLQELQLADLVEDEQKDAKVFINLTIEEHASFGFSVDGRVVTSIDLKCRNCFRTYCRKIDEGFKVWVLPLRRRHTRENQLPEIGGDDPSVIYVKPGQEAELDSLVQETIRLTTSINDTCSDSCANSETRDIYIGPKQNASVAKRWGKLLELKKGK